MAISSSSWKIALFCGHMSLPVSNLYCNNVFILHHFQYITTLNACNVETSFILDVRVHFIGHIPDNVTLQACDRWPDGLRDRRTDWAIAYTTLVTTHVITQYKFTSSKLCQDSSNFPKTNSRSLHTDGAIWQKSLLLNQMIRSVDCRHSRVAFVPQTAVQAF